jgi:hypothetical protein
MKAIKIFHEKRMMLNQKSGEAAVAELKVWSVPGSKDFPEGRKFSLFLVARGQVIVGMDNHKPKGPHIHLGEHELPYSFRGEKELLMDFWDLTKKAGFEP